MKKLSDKQKEMLKLHSKPHKNKSGKTVPGHSKEHMRAMKIMMENGVSFNNAHEITMKILGT